MIPIVTQSGDALRPDSSQADKDRIDQLEQMLLPIARHLGFFITSFHVDEDRYGSKPPRITVELVQGPPHEREVGHDGD